MTTYDFFSLVAIMFLVRLSSEGTAWVLMIIFSLLGLGNLALLLLG